MRTLSSFLLLAWVMRLERDFRFEAVLDKTLEFIDRRFADPAHDGYWDCLPRADALRRQNPHMHLFEAFLTLHESTDRADILERCRRMHNLAIARFFDASSGTIRETYDDFWNVHPAPGAGTVEPGHLFEWAWLLRRFEAATELKQDALVSKLIGAALAWGVDVARGRVVDEIGEDGSVRAASSRSWPHAEALRALSEERNRGTIDHAEVIFALIHRIRSTYCLDRLKGGWIDHVDANDRPTSKTMPASTLYHLYFGLTAVSSGK